LLFYFRFIEIMSDPVNQKNDILVNVDLEPPQPCSQSQNPAKSQKSKSQQNDLGSSGSSTGPVELPPAIMGAAAIGMNQCKVA
jgi:hypothetical protein